MHTRSKAGLMVLAAIGAVSSVQLLAGNAFAQQGGGGLGGGGAGQGFGQRRPMQNNRTTKVTIDEAIKTATSKTPGYVNSATLQPAGPPVQGEPPKLVWVIHVVTEPGTGPGSPGKGASVAVDGTNNTVVDMPPPPRGFYGGGPGGPPRLLPAAALAAVEASS